MVIHPVMVMQPESLMIKLSGEVCIYGGVAAAFVLCLHYSFSNVNMCAVYVYGNDYVACVYHATVIRCSLCLW